MAGKKTKVKGIEYGTPGLKGKLDGPSPDEGKVSVGFGVSAPADPAPAKSAKTPKAAPSASPSSSANSEAKAVIAVLRALEGLPADAVQRVLTVVVGEYSAAVAAPAKGSTATGQSAQNEAQLGQPDLPSLIKAGGAKSDSMRCLFVAYWMTIVEGAEDFTPVDLERELAQMQQPVDDIEEAFAALLGRKYVVELPSERQTKRYVLTPEGLNAVWSSVA